MRKYLKTVLSSLAALFLAAGVACAEPKMVNPNDHYAGLTYGDWSAVWWQFMIETPNANALFGDDNSPGGYNCNAGQTAGPVFFLVGGGPATATRTCTVPAGQALFFPIINAECSTLEAAPFHGDSEYALRTCASLWGNATDVNSLKVTVDGAPLQNLKNTRAQSPVFTFHSVPTGNFGLEGTGLSVADGYWVLLNPLSIGKHTIHFEGKAPSIPGGGANVQNVTYFLTVQ